MNKKLKVTGIVSVLVGLLFSAASVFASSGTTLAQAGKTPEPAVKATVDARLTQDAGALATKKAEAEATQAAGKLPGNRATFKGTVASLGSDSLTLSLSGGGSMTFHVVPATRFRNSSGLANVHVGEHALVQALKNDPGATALFIAIVADKDVKPAMVHRVGNVTAYTPGASITIADKDGHSATFLINADTTILPAGSQLAVGARVTIVAHGDPSTGSVVAHGIVVHPQTPASS